MSPELLQAAYTLQAAASEYKALYYNEFNQSPAKEPVVWLCNDTTGQSVFLTDALNAELIKNAVPNLRESK